MARLCLGLVLHNHQPVGNYGFVIEDVYEKAYAPMLAALERHPAIRVAIHNSGCLIDWLVAHRPEYLDGLRRLTDRGQVELLTGGYYEPVLPMIADADKVGQIRKLSAFVEARFGQRPTGLWLTERVWEPGLPAPLAAAGVEWTVVDDAHFRMSGMRDQQLDGYYITEDQGARIKLFAGSQRLRYAIPWHDVDEVIAELRQLAEASANEAPYVVLGDDGEKFGAWPTTYEHVWENGWIERFFTALEAERDWLELMTPGEYAGRFEARGLTYLPAASYAEMMEWAMPADAAAEFGRLSHDLAGEGREDVARYMRGGTWRYFLAKYAEANAMHKRGVRIASKLAAVDDEAAREALWAAQCNCPYWHGVFGGLYLRHIRAATNANLVRAERLADEAAGATSLRIIEDDVDYDGHDELLVQSPDISLLVHPKVGGMISEFDLRRRDHALLDVLARRREAYHEALLAGPPEASGDDAAPANIHGELRVKEPGLAEALVFDRHRRGGLQEWILDSGATPEQFSRGEARANFQPAGEWTVESAVDGAVARIRLERAVSGWRVIKEIDVPADGEHVHVRYEIACEGSGPEEVIFASEWNLSPPHAPDGDDRIAIADAGDGRIALTQLGMIEDVCELTLRGSADYGLRLECGEPVDIWHFPVETISSSEGGIERTLQGVSVSVVRRLALNGGEGASFGFSWRVV